jgi:hypothetical protein
MTIRQILVDWSATGGPATSVFFFTTAVGTAGAQRQRIDDIMEAVAPHLTTTTTWSVQQSGAELNEFTGQTVGAWGDATVVGGAGGLTGQSVADATQVLLQWRTGQFRDGHEVRGRTYVPGLGINRLLNGEISPTNLATMRTAVGTAASAAAIDGMIIWHRPIIDPETGAVTRQGSTSPLLSGTVWDELAVLRRRRS